MGPIHTQAAKIVQSYSFKAQRTPQRTDQRRILGCDLYHSNLAHKKKCKKTSTFFLPKKAFCFPLL